MNNATDHRTECRNCREDLADAPETGSCFHCGFAVSVYATRKEAFRAFQSHLQDPATIVTNPHRATSGWVISHAQLLMV